MSKIIAERYELLELIGQGGMADVYLAKDIILNRTIAIKILRTSLAKDPIYVTRFQREASAAAALSHKNIVEIYDVGEDEDKYYIVMEYVPGTTLKELILKRGALHYVEAIDIMKQVVGGIAKAHQLGIIHRDLKPQNILVTDSGVAKIADFGIASMQSLAQVTQTDVIMGSLHYLAPEIARGEKATVQSDIYALGIAFYELLRGEVPFNGESPVNIALKHMQDDLPSLLEFNPSIPQSVENIIIKATAKNLNDRYHNATEMLDDLNTCLDRLNEEKLVFSYDNEPEPTIVLDSREVFSGENTGNIASKEAIKDDDAKEDPERLAGCRLPCGGRCQVPVFRDHGGRKSDQQAAAGRRIPVRRAGVQRLSRHLQDHGEAYGAHLHLGYDGADLHGAWLHESDVPALRPDEAGRGAGGAGPRCRDGRRRPADVRFRRLDRGQPLRALRRGLHGADDGPVYGRACPCGHAG